MANTLEELSSSCLMTQFVDIFVNLLPIVQMNGDSAPYVCRHGAQAPFEAYWMSQLELSSKLSKLSNNGLISSLIIVFKLL